MRFMMFVKSNEQSEAGAMPDEKILSEMGKFNEEMARAGVMLAGEGLHPSSKGARVSYSGGKFTVTDGPFAEAKELVGGYWLIQAPSKEEAIDWAKRVPFQEGEVEIRPLFELDDFPVDPAEGEDGWREKEQRFRDEAETSGSGNFTQAAEGKIRYMMFLNADKNSEAGVMPDEKLLTGMGDLMQEMVDKGVLLSGEGLQPSSKGARVQYSGKNRTVIDGPFPETKELVAGYAMIQVESKEEAIDWAKRFLEVGSDVENGVEAQGELRRVFELSDFAPSEAVERAAQLRDELVANQAGK